MQQLATSARRFLSARTWSTYNVKAIVEKKFGLVVEIVNKKLQDENAAENNLVQETMVMIKH